MTIRYFLLWLPMILLAFANAALREIVLIKHFTEFRAHQLSTITLLVLCSIYCLAVYRALRVASAGQALFAGGLWTLLTILFEFCLGRITGKSWTYLLRDYDLLAGRVWLLFLLCLLFLPFLIYSMKKKAE